MMPHIQWTHPEWLWALLPLAAGVVLLSVKGWARPAAMGVRFVWLALAAVALAGPGAVSERVQTSRPRTIVLVDQSQSVAGDSARRDEYVRQLAGSGSGEDAAEVVGFAGDVGAGGGVGDASQCRIGAAIAWADHQNLEASDTRVILVSDGRATEGDAVLAARQLALRGGRVDVIPIGRAAWRRPRIARVEPSPQCRQGIAASVRVGLESPASARATIRLLDEQKKVVDERQLTVDGRMTAMLHFTPGETGLNQYTVELETEGGGQQAAGSGQFGEGASGQREAEGSGQQIGGGGVRVLADSRAMAVHVEGPPRILLADPFPGDADALKRAIEPLGLPIDQITPDQWPASLEEYATVILSDFSGGELSGAQREQLRRYVEERGGGLVFIGGGNTVVSRWRQNPIAQMLPMELKPPAADLPKKPPPVSICYVFDRSGSMGGMLGGNVSKLDMVKAAIQASLQSLPDGTTVAVVAFDGQADVIVPPTSVVLKDQIADLLDRVVLGGGTDVYVGVTDSISVLSAMPGSKYLVVLTDGMTVSPPGGARAWSAMAAGAKRNRINWTSIAVGEGADQALMRGLATGAGGRYFYCDRGDQIPQVFISQAKDVQRKTKVDRKPFHPRPGPMADRLKQIAVRDLPQLDGQVKTESRSAAETVLLGENDQPLLSGWQFGVGRVAGFASDAKNLWADRWVDWGGFGVFWSQVVGETLKPQSRLHVAVHSHGTRQKPSFTLSVSDDQGRPMTDVKTTAELEAWPAELSASASPAVPPVTGSPVQWRRPFPGDYQASVDMTDRSGSWLLSVYLTTPDRQTVRYSVMLGGEQSSEMAETGPDMTAIGAIADAGGGRCVVEPALLMEQLQPVTRMLTATRPLWPLCLMAALVLWPVDVWIRKRGGV